MSQVSFSAAAQPQTQPQAQPHAPEKKKPSIILPVAVGAVAGAGVGYFTPLGTKPAYESADEFIKSDKFEDALKNVPDDKKADADKIKAAKTAQDEIKKANGTTLEELFKDKKDDEEIPLSNLLGKIKGTPTAEALKATVVDNADNSLKEKEQELGQIQDAAKDLENEKSKEIGEGDKKITIAKDKDGKITFTKKDSAAVNLEKHAQAIADERAAFDSNHALAEAIGITKDAIPEKINKTKSEAALNAVVPKATTDIQEAFKNISGKLGKKIAPLKFAVTIAAGAALAGVLASVFGGSSEK